MQTDPQQKISTTTATKAAKAIKLAAEDKATTNCESDTPRESDPESELTDAQKIEIVARSILTKYAKAFEELAK